jgi:hypothetical protein
MERAGEGLRGIERAQRIYDIIVATLTPNKQTHSLTQKSLRASASRSKGGGGGILSRESGGRKKSKAP